MGDENDSRGAIVYAEATRVLDQQLASLSNIQDRAGILLSAASIAASFFAALAIRQGEALTIWAWLAIGAFLAVAVGCVWLLLPRGLWTFRFNVGALVENCLEADPPPTLAKMHHDLSKQMHQWDGENRERLYNMMRVFRAAGIALGFEVAFWITDLLWRR
jgi:hypothetical protein